MLAFLRRHEAALLACGEDTLPETISTLRFTGNVEVGGYWVLGWRGGGWPLLLRFQCYRFVSYSMLDRLFR